MARRILSVLVLLALAVPAAAGADVVLWHGEDTNISALWMRDELLYIFTRNAYRTWSGGGADVVEHPFSPALSGGEFLSAVVPGGDGLWALLVNAESDAWLAEVSFDESGNASLGARVSLDWRGILGAEYLSILSPMVQDGILVFASTADDGCGVVATVNLETGEGVAIDADADGYRIDARAVFPYGNAALVASAVQGAKNGVAFYTLDPATGGMAAAFTMPAVDPYSFGAPVGDAENDAVYFALDGKLLCVTGFDPDSAEEIGDASALMTFTDTFAARMDDGTIVTADWYTVRAYGGAEAPEGARLSVSADSDELLNDAYYAYQEKYPDAQVDIGNQHLSPGDVSTAILTQSTAWDIYVTSLNWRDYSALYEKGYLPSLSESEALTTFTAGLYPAIREMVESDGAPVAVPVRLDLNMPAYNPAAFEALGLTEADVPTTWPEFLRLLARLPALIDGTDYTAFGPSNREEDLPYSVLDDILRDYELYLENDASAGMLFDTDILRALLVEYEKIDFSALGAPAEWDDNADFEFGDRHALFEAGAYAVCYGETSEYRRFMPLALAEGMEPMVEGSLYVAILNPYSQNRKAALWFLETAVEIMPETTRANMTPGWTEPIKFEGIDETLATYEARIAELEEEVKNAAGDEKAQYQELLDTWTEGYAGWQAQYWYVTDEMLAGYRARAQYMRVWRNFGLDMEAQGEMGDLITRYLDGAIDAKTMLQNIDKKINMMLLEGQ